MRILIVEHDFVSRNVMVRTLEKRKYEVRSVDSGAEAWPIICSETPPDIVVMNLIMPDMDGLQLVDKIRSRKTSGYIFLLILTSKSDKQDIIQGMDRGADDYLTKPFYHGELLARIRAGERIVRLEHELAQQNAQLQQANAILVRTNERMKRDLEAAAEVQQTLLPKSVPDISGVNVAWCYHPCNELGGDIFNVFLLDEKHLAFYLLDVSGHGVSAALLSVTLSRLLSLRDDEMSFLRKKCASAGKHEIVAPSEVASRLNKRFLLNDESQQYFTLVYCILNLQSHKLKFVSAGHPNPLLFSAGDGAVSFGKASMPIGFCEDERYVDKTCDLQPGDRLYLYSDGVNEATNVSGEQFGVLRFRQALEKTRAKSLQQSIDESIETVKAWAHPRLQDDISVLAIELVAL